MGSLTEPGLRGRLVAEQPPEAQLEVVLDELNARRSRLAVVVSKTPVVFSPSFHVGEVFEDQIWHVDDLWK
jgi:hypothetical protein